MAVYVVSDIHGYYDLFEYFNDGRHIAPPSYVSQYKTR